MGAASLRLHGLCCIAFVVVTALGWAVVAAPRGVWGSLYTVWHFVLLLCMLGAWRASLDDPLRCRHGTLAAGLLARLLLLALPAFTSHDIDRYLWDGAVALAGFDPYRTAPDAAALQSLRALWPTPPEHAGYPTLYPPGALALYALSASAGPQWGPWLWKLLACGAGIATLLLARDLLARRGALQHLPLVALSPLLLLETGVGAHADAFSALAVVAALWAFETRRLALCGAALGLGALVKLLPALAWLPLALLLLTRRRLRDAVALSLGLALTLALGYGLALALGLQPVGSLGLFFERWRFGSPLFAAAEWLLPPRTAGIMMLALGMALLAAAALRSRSDLLAGLQWALAAPLLVSPVVFPWYLCALAPLAALRPRAWLLVWLAVVPLSYEVVDGFAGAGVWLPAAWPLWALAAAGCAGLWFDRRHGAVA